MTQPTKRGTRADASPLEHPGVRCNTNNTNGKINDDLDDRDNNNDNNNHDSEKQSSRYFTIFSLRRQLSPTCTLTWPRRNSVLIMYNTFCDSLVQNVVCHELRRESSTTRVHLKCVPALRCSLNRTRVSCTLRSLPRQVGGTLIRPAADQRGSGHR